MNRKLKPGIYKTVIALGIIGLYTAAFGIYTDYPAASIIGIITVFGTGIISINEESKKQQTVGGE